jgi:hypothetical protein
MDWKLNVIIAIGIITLVASVLGGLQQIIKFVKEVTLPMCRWKWKRQGTWPLNITVKSADFWQGPSSSLLVEVLVVPRKPVILGRCEFIDLTENRSLYIRTPIDGIVGDFQEWKVADHLDSARTYSLSFLASADLINHQGQVQIESEGYISKSNVIQIT